MPWDPGQYLKFAGERTRPAVDLLARVPIEAPETVVDLGCGAGHLAPLLRARWPRARIVGVDSSPEMLERARAASPEVEWVRGDIARWAPERPVDVLLSNASLHWLDDHARLFPRLLRCVAPRGRLAVQVPRNFEAPSHRAVREAALEGPWRERLAPRLRPTPVATPHDYWRWLRPHAAALDLWESEYLQALAGEHPVAEFVKGSWLKPLLDALDEPERSVFERVYRGKVSAAYPREPDGTTLFPFRRLFLVAEPSPGIRA